MGKLYKYVVHLKAVPYLNLSIEEDENLAKETPLWFLAKFENRLLQMDLKNKFSLWN
jgi:hypothetical protein